MPNASNLASRSSMFMTLAMIVAMPGATDMRARANEAAQAFTKNCGDCHDSRSINLWRKKQPDDDKRKAWLESLMAKHYPPPVAVRALIIKHLTAPDK